jgi:hypothetical protein
LIGELKLWEAACRQGVELDGNLLQRGGEAVWSLIAYLILKNILKE